MNILKNLLVSVALLVAASGANAADVVDLGELNAGINTYGTTVAANTEFNHTFNFSLADVSSVNFSLDKLVLNNGSTSVYNFTSLTYSLFSSSDNSQLAFATSNGEFSFAALAAGNYYIDVAGKSSGVAGGIYSGSINVAAVPEPSSVAMLMIGFAALGAVARRRRNKL
ncbi:FxDxF family PEP-CTERM protein [Methylobacillus gramineus]|uniref:FxDxF family PEP-CTERM protein n=1 Tax=Methylobacillus gramineus TaxID=755169 RepID=UPI001CFF765B|nr:FxDxF family PEP-CTERM protein [Methylobacillus gramineus]MCB5186053.1 FxDxF family PEP-CTERM protein [Methylobacillus gramineus]